MKVEIAFEIPDAVVRAAPVVAIIVLLTAWLFILVRRRRKRERAERLMFAIRRDFIPRSECAATEEIRREIDDSHKKYERLRIEEQWKRDGSILLERRSDA